MSEKCLDQLYYLACDAQDAMYMEPIWDGYAADFARSSNLSGFKGVLDRVIEEGYILPNGDPLKPGPYVIFRLDRSADENADPCVAWLGTLGDDMKTISDGFMPPKTPLVTRWPPKS